LASLMLFLIVSGCKCQFKFESGPYGPHTGAKMATRTVLF
jgi:hypothetical protein